MSAAARRALAAYGAVHTQTVVDGADPATLVRLLFDGAVDALLDAEGCIARSHRQSKAKALQKATEILLALKGALNTEAAASSRVRLTSFMAIAYAACFTGISTMT